MFLDPRRDMIEKNCLFTYAWQKCLNFQAMPRAFFKAAFKELSHEMQLTMNVAMSSNLPSRSAIFNVLLFALLYELLNVATPTVNVPSPGDVTAL